jgi:porin
VILSSTFVLAPLLASLPAGDPACGCDERVAGTHGAASSEALVEPFQGTPVPEGSDFLPSLLPALVERGITVDAGHTYDISAPPSGGIGDDAAKRGLFDLGVELNLERLVGLEGGVAFGEFYSQAGRNGSSITGDIQGYSNIDADNVAQLAELWYEQTLLEGALRFKLGKVDANSEFAYVEAGAEFLNSSAGFSPTIHALPTYPDPAVGANVFVQDVGGLYASLGAYNAEDGGTVSGRRGMTAEFEESFLIGEVGLEWDSGIEDRPGRFGLGAWHHSGEFEEFGGGSADGAAGFYAIAEHTIHREGDAGERSLTLFAQLGLAEAEVSEVEHHLGAGALCIGLLPGRDEEPTGLYVSHAGLSEEAGSGLSGSELAIEVFHAFQVRPWLTIKPDLQLIIDPAGRSDIHDALVGTLRIEFF